MDEQDILAAIERGRQAGRAMRAGRRPGEPGPWSLQSFLTAPPQTDSKPSSSRKRQGSRKAASERRSDSPRARARETDDPYIRPGAVLSDADALPPPPLSAPAPLLLPQEFALPSGQVWQPLIPSEIMAEVYPEFEPIREYLLRSDRGRVLQAEASRRRRWAQRRKQEQEVDFFYDEEANDD